jgi:hypothetical protein
MREQQQSRLRLLPWQGGQGPQTDEQCEREGEPQQSLEAPVQSFPDHRLPFVDIETRAKHNDNDSHQHVKIKRFQRA